MDNFFQIKYVNRINLMLLLVSLFFIIYSFLVIKNNNYYEKKIKSINTSEKYKKRNIILLFEDNTTIKYSFDDNFFNLNKYLNFRKGYNIIYSVNNNQVTSLKNPKNGYELNQFYLSVYDNKTVLIFFSILIFIYNSMAIANVDLLKRTVFKNEKRNIFSQTITKINNFTIKHNIVTFFVLIPIIYFIYLGFNLIKNKQVILQGMSLYKYLFLFNVYLIPLPFVIYNFLVIKKLDKKLKIN